jgi:hypothetical protein
MRQLPDHTMNNNGRPGLTIVELLVVFAIVVLVAALAVVGIQSLRALDTRGQCANNLRRIAMACHNANSTLGSMPPYDSRAMPDGNVYGKNGTTYGSVFYHLLPFLENAALYDDGLFLANSSPDGWGCSVTIVQGTGGPIPTFPIPDAKDPVGGNGRPQVLEVVQRMFICPGDPTARNQVCTNGWAGASYGVNFLVVANPHAVPADKNDPDGLGGSGTKGEWAAKVVFPASFPDGESETILIAEKYLVCGDGTPEGANTTGTAWAWANHDSRFAPAVAMESPWNDGTKFQVLPSPDGCDWRYAQTGHVKGMNLAAADGSVHYYDVRISPVTYLYAMDPSDGHTNQNACWSGHDF